MASAFLSAPISLGTPRTLRVGANAGSIISGHGRYRVGSCIARRRKQ